MALHCVWQANRRHNQRTGQGWLRRENRSPRKHPSQGGGEAAKKQRKELEDRVALLREMDEKAEDLGALRKVTEQSA